MATLLPVDQSTAHHALSGHIKRGSWSSISSLTMAMSAITTQPPTPHSLSPPSGVPLIAASPRDTLMFHPAAEISFSIEEIVQVTVDPPIVNSIMPPILETRVRIADGGRDTLICAAEMTASMQMKLRKLASKELQESFRVTRSDEVGSKGLYTLVKPAWSGRSRPRSLQLGLNPSSPSPLNSMKTPKSSLMSGRFLGLLTPTSVPASEGTSPKESYFD